METQSERNEQSKEIEKFRTENKKHFADMNRRINDGKLYHEKLTKEVKSCLSTPSRYINYQIPYDSVLTGNKNHPTFEVKFLLY